MPPKDESRDQPDDHLAGQAADPNSFTVTLKERHAEYVRNRAAFHGRTPEAELAFIVMEFWSQHDEWQRVNAPGATRPGVMPLVG